MDSVILDAQGAPVQAVAFCLLRDQMVFGNVKFFLMRIARQLDEPWRNGMKTQLASARVET